MTRRRPGSSARARPWPYPLWACVVAVAIGSCAPAPAPPTQGGAASSTLAADARSEGGPEDRVASASTEAEEETSPALPGGLEPAALPTLQNGPEDGDGRATAYWGGSRARLGVKSPWASIARDGLHDPGSDAVGLLQEPRQAMRGFPRTSSGNYVDWVKTLEGGLIRPRARAGSRGAMNVLDLDVVLVDTKPMPTVTFSHRVHTEWLSCGNCHDWLFEKQAGATEITMEGIFRRRTCGLCHGKVAFPPDECFRCHNGPRPGQETASVQP